MVWNAKMDVFFFELGENPSFDAMDSECPIYTKRKPPFWPYHGPTLVPQNS
jgi:hypothetical protein